MSDTQRQNTNGSWSTAVPLPMYIRHWFVMRYKCWAKNTAKDSRCGELFKTPRDYEKHYLSNHARNEL